MTVATTCTTRIIHIDDEANWNSCLEQYKYVEPYHSHGYVAAHAESERCNAFVLEGSTSCCSQAIVLNANDISFEPKYRDLTSPYGYSGPLVRGKHHSSCLEEILEKFQEILTQQLYVALTARMNPFDPSAQSVAEWGRVRAISEVVVVDLSLTSDTRRANYKKTLRYDLRKLRQSGARCEILDAGNCAALFHQTYDAEMSTKNASKKLRFSKDYFNKIFNSNTLDCRPYACLIDEKIAAVSCFLFGNNNVHYHLSATVPDYRKFSPSKLIIDHVADIAHDESYKWLNLGGGLGGNDDSLFRFKSGFSGERRTFNLLEKVLNNEAYSKLVEKSRALSTNQSNNYFPAYRVA